MEKEHRESRARKRTCYDHDAQQEVEKAASEGGGRNVNIQRDKTDVIEGNGQITQKSDK